MFVLLFASSAAAEPSTTISVSTGSLTRELTVREGRLSTVRFVDSATGRELPVAADSPEFALVLMDGTRLTADDYRVASHKAAQAGQVRAETFALEPRARGLPTLAVEYSAGAGDSVLRKRITVAGEAVVDRIEVECLRVRGRADVGGFGQPVFVGDAWFAGLEYPAGTNDLSGGLLTCAHHPGRAAFTSKTAVIGSAGTDSIEDAFQRYLDTVRRPPRPSLQYNAWYDKRGKEIAPAGMLETFRRFDEKLLTPFGLTFDAFVVDDGWQNLQSAWECSSAWPEGFAPLAAALKAKGSRMGLWLPLNGYGLDPSWAAGQGWQRTDAGKAYFCLAAEKYPALLRTAIKARIAEGDLSYIKHDFNFLRCSAEGHGHLATARHGREANVDAQLELLAYERSLKPEILLNLTTDTWLSPWWLMHADAVWMGGYDCGREPAVPNPGGRHEEMTYRDAELFRRLRVERAQFPASALMTHGVIRGRYEGIDAGETLRDWCDYLAMWFGRGTMLHELYISPDLMPDDRWPALAAAIRWARSNTATLAHARMIGGRPERGEPYGYIHWSADKGIACLRNPGPVPVEFALSAAERPAHLPARAAWHPVVVYPHRERLPATSAAPMRLTLPAASVTLVELYAEWPAAWRDVPVGRFDFAERDGKPIIVIYGEPNAECRPTGDTDIGRKEWKGSFALAWPDNAEAEVRLVRAPAGGVSAAVRVDGSRIAAAERNAGPGWEWQTYALASGGRKPPESSNAGNASQESGGSRPPLANTEVSLDITLPLGPQWPQRATISAGLTIRTPLVETKVVALPAGTALPPWPVLADPGVARQDFSLIDDHHFTRTRRPIESLGWLLLIGVLPAVAVPLAAWRLLLHRRPRWAIPAAAASLVLLAVVYRLTFLAEAVGRMLTE